VRSHRCVRRVGRAGAARIRNAVFDECARAQGGSIMSIVLRGVSKRFDKFAALENISVEIPGGSLTALVGPSGGGKSTLLRVIAGLERPDSGEGETEGSNPLDIPVQDRGVGFVFQHYAAFKHMTVWDNIAFGMSIRKRPASEIRARVDQLLRLVQLEGRRSRLPPQRFPR